ncbi:hypothetical protein J4221_06020 [Candidatus Pacearchaeota archaeon]|nr:hypothetical protein [Candidatus Pacearchaeota archaeon]
MENRKLIGWIQIGIAIIIAFLVFNTSWYIPNEPPNTDFQTEQYMLSIQRTAESIDKFQWAGYLTALAILLQGITNINIKFEW